MLITLAVTGVSLIKVVLVQHNKVMQAVKEARKKEQG